MRAAGLQFTGPVKKHSIGLLTGLTFVLTGAFPTLKREDAKKRIESAGGKVASAVSTKTSYVVAGDEAGSKLERATELNIPVLDEPGLLAMLDGKS